jgi:WD40 repeat protein/serine/threonine protein kinase
MRPRRFGDYELLEEVARGGMGVVFKARQISLKRLVALKMILGGHLADVQAIERFKAEARAAALLDHPNIVPIYEIGELEGQHFFSMAFIPGLSLQQRGLQGPLPPREAARLLQQIAEAIQYAHEQGVIHRDLKPQNVLLQGAEVDTPRDGSRGASGRDTNSTRAADTEHERTPGTSRGDSRNGASGPQSGVSLTIPKVTDFGLAKIVSDNSNMTASGEVIGTPSYMAPEQAEGKTSEVGVQSDVYSLGAILYFLLTGRPPFQSATAVETLRQVLEQDPVPPRQLNPGVPRDLENVCLQCLQKEPRRRYHSARELASELNRFLTGQPVLARPVSQPERLWRWMRRNPTVSGLLAAVVLTLLLGITFSTLYAVEARTKAAEAAENERQANTREEEAKAARQLAEQEKRETERQLNRADWLLYGNRITLAQRQWQDGEVAHANSLLDACRWDFRGWELDYLHELFSSNQRSLAGHQDSVYGVAFSRDGTRLASVSRGGLLIWELESGRQLLRLTVKGRGMYGVAFSPDGTRVVASCGHESRDDLPSEVQVWDIAARKQLFGLTGHTGRIFGVAWSPDGKLIASAGKDGTVCLWDAASGQSKQILKGHTEIVYNIAFSPDGTRLVSSSADSLAKLWEVSSGRELLTLREHTCSIVGVAFSPDGKRIASGAVDGSIRLCDAQSGQSVLAFHGHSKTVMSLAFSGDGKRLASASHDGTLKVWDARTGYRLNTLKGHTSLVNGVAFHPDSVRLASGSSDRLVKIWDAGQQQEPPILRGHTAQVTCVGCSPDGKLIASGSGDNTIRLWDSASRSVVRILNGHTKSITRIAFSPDGKRLASTSWDGSLRLWETATGKEVSCKSRPQQISFDVSFSRDGKLLASAWGDEKMLNTRGEVLVLDLATQATIRVLRGEDRILGIAFSPDGKRLAACEAARSARVWEVGSGKCVHNLEGMQGYASSMACSPDGRWIAVGTGDPSEGRRWGRVYLWDAVTGQLAYQHTGHSDVIQGLAFSPDSTRLVTAGSDRVVQIWSLDVAQPLLALKSHNAAVLGVAFAPDGRRLVSGGADGTVRLWEAGSGPRVRTLRGHSETINSVAFSPDGRLLATGGGPSAVIRKGIGEVKLWDVIRGVELRALAGHDGAVSAVAFSPNGELLASSSGTSVLEKQNGEVKIWETATGRCRAILPGQQTGILALDFSPDGTRLATAHSDDTLKLWDVQTAQPLVTLRGHRSIINCCSFSPDGTKLLSGSWDNTLRLWDVTTGQCVQVFKGHEGMVTAAAFTAGGARLVSTANDGTLRLWDANLGQELRQIRAGGSLAGLGVSPDGRFILAGDQEYRVRVWDLTTGQLMHTLTEHRDAITAVSLSRDGSKLATCSRDLHLKVWNFPTLPLQR